MSTTCADLIAETQAHLYSTARDPLNKLNGSLDASTTTVILTYGVGAAREGAILSVDLELMYVWEVTNEATSTLVVERGYGGSTAATHTAASLVTVNPRFSNFNVFRALNADLADLSANGLFQVGTVGLTYDAAVQGYNLTSVTDLLEVLQVRYDEPGAAKLWPEIKSYKLRRASSTSDFASGNAIVVYEAGHAGAELRVTYAKPFTAFTTMASTIASTGLPSTAYDIPPYGAALRLQSVREGQRNFNESQPATRRADEIGLGAQLQSAVGLNQIRRDRIRVEASRLRKFWPTKRRVPGS